MEPRDDDPSTHPLTTLLAAAEAGDSEAAERLLPLVYDELRRLARSRLGREAVGQTLQPTALVHEAYLRLVGSGPASFANRAHFFAAAALAMRRILVERARRKARRRHGGEHERVSLSGLEATVEPRLVDLLALDEALERLAALDRRKEAIVCLRFFGGLEIAECAQALGVSPATVKSDWAFARAWLHRELEGEPERRSRES